MSRRFPVAARLTTILVAVAMLTLLLAAIVQDRAFSRGLEQAAEERLDGSAAAVARLTGEHLQELALRYSAISRSPEFRAHLELGHRATLNRMARTLGEPTGAELVLLLDRNLSVRARHGGRPLGAALLAGWHELGEIEGDAQACLRPGGDALPPGQTPIFGACAVGAEAPAQATLQRIETGVYATLWLPLATGERAVGALLVAEALDEAQLATWSQLVGARVEIAAPDSAPGQPLVRRVLALPGLELRVSSSFEPERQTLAAARRNQLIAGVVVLWIAIAVSIWVARDFLRPIREIQRATEEVGRGNLDVRLDTSRGDELGDVSRVLNGTLERLRYSQQRLQNVQRVARFGDWSADPVAAWVEGSAEFARTLGLMPDSDGYRLEAVLACFPEKERGELEVALARCTQEGASIELDLRRTREGIEERIIHVRGRRVMDPDGRARLEGSVQDVTDRRHAEEQIRYLAFHDSLTGLPNRRFLTERLALAMAPGRSKGFSVLFFDLDRFKMVNDTLGHSAGDELLREVAHRIKQALPESTEASVARFGGDEFTLLLPGLVEPSALAELAERLLLRVAEPCEIQGHELVATGSLGGARFPEDGDTIEALLRSCDTALHRAKDAGRNAFRLFDDSMRDAASERWRLESRLRRAVETNALQVYYQPRVEAATGELGGFEALLRWQDADFGGYRPDEFVPIAEETGLIVPLGTWVLRSVLEQIRVWLDQGLPVGWVSVNLSGRQLTPELVGIVRGALEDSGVDSRHLELEVTESAVIEDDEMGIGVLTELRELGIRVSLDDFGTGYSSLSYLRNLPIAGVKIDRSFVNSIASDEQGAALVASIVSMAKVLGLFVVAEGVETEEQVEILTEMGCDELQGYFYGQAGPAEEARRRLRERARRRAPEERKVAEG